MAFLVVMVGNLSPTTPQKHIHVNLAAIPMPHLKMATANANKIITAQSLV
jgi:hypothetical protein